MSIYLETIRGMDDKTLAEYMEVLRRHAYAQGTHAAKGEVADALEAIAKRCEATPNGMLAMIAWDQDEVSCYRSDDSTLIHANIIHIDARTIRTFMHYCTGR